MKKIALSLATIAMALVLSVGATSAYFSDTETSTGNTFAAGTLDLNVDGGNANVVKFNVTNMRPVNSQPNSGWVLKNVGSIPGYLDLTNISVTGYEHECTEPEVEAGDSTCDATEGELQDVTKVALFLDLNKDGWISTGEPVFYNNGTVGGLPTGFDLNYLLNPGQEVRVGAIVNWWSTAQDNKAQNDSMTLDMTFFLNQIQ